MGDDLDQICDLECMKGGTVHEFVGPVKIIVMDPPDDEHSRKESGAAFAGLANLMIGANFAIVAFFVLGFKLPKYLNLHIILCTTGYQFLMPIAILMMNSLNGPAAPLKKTQRKREHFFLNFMGLACGVLGTFVVYEYGEKSIVEPDIDKLTTPHFYCGVATGCLAVLTALFGPIIYFMKEPNILGSMHRVLGMLAFLSSSICFVLGIIKPSFQIWLYIIGYMGPSYLIMFFVSFYTFAVLATPMLKLIKGTNY